MENLYWRYIDIAIKAMDEISEEQAIEAVRTIIKYIGDDPQRTEIVDTPKRVIDLYKNFFKGYGQSLENNTIANLSNSDDMITMKDIKFISFCEHHMMPIIGKIDISYIPNTRIIGIGKIVSIIDSFTKRLQIQERFTEQIAKALEDVLDPKGIAVHVSAEHYCLRIKRSDQDISKLYTSCALGVMK